LGAFGKKRRHDVKKKKRSLSAKGRENSDHPERRKTTTTQGKREVYDTIKELTAKKKTEDEFGGRKNEG